MRKLLIVIVFLTSVSSYADIYDCTIPKSNLPFSTDMDLNFTVVNEANTAPLILILGDSVSDHCRHTEENKIYCEDAERMPYIADIISETEITLEIGRGAFLPETKASCTKK